MAKLTDREREEFIRLAKSPRIQQPKPMIQPLADFLRSLSSLSRTIPSHHPARFQGKHWYL
jgi:hypothetical protein